MKFFNKRGVAIVFNTLIPWIIALLVLIVIIVIYVVLSGKAGGGIDFLKNILRFGG